MANIFLRTYLISLMSFDVLLQVSTISNHNVACPFRLFDIKVLVVRGQAAIESCPRARLQSGGSRRTFELRPLVSRTTTTSPLLLTFNDGQGPLLIATAPVSSSNPISEARSPPGLSCHSVSMYFFSSVSDSPAGHGGLVSEPLHSQLPSREELIVYCRRLSLWLMLHNRIGGSRTCSRPM